MAYVRLVIHFRMHISVADKEFSAKNLNLHLNWSYQTRFRKTESDSWFPTLGIDKKLLTRLNTVKS